MQGYSHRRSMEASRVVSEEPWRSTEAAREVRAVLWRSMEAAREARVALAGTSINEVAIERVG